MDWTAIVELLKQPEVVFLVIIIMILLFTTQVGKVIIGRVMNKYMPGKEEVPCIKDSPIIVAYIDKELSKLERIWEINRIDKIMESYILIGRLSDSIQIMMEDHYKTMTHDRTDLRQYHHLLNSSFKVLRGELRQWVKRNRLLERSEIDFNHYVEDTAREIFTLACKLIADDYYDDDFTVSMEVWHKSRVDILERDIIDKIEHTLKDIREVFKVKQEEIKKIREE